MKSSLLSSFVIAGILLLIGLTMLVIQFIRAETLKYSLNLTVVLLSIPAVTLLFLRYGSVTSWVFPIVLIVVALVFNRRSMLVGVSAVSVLTQVFLWMYSKSEPFRLMDIDYMIRILFFMVVILLGMRINRIYISKLKENAYQMRLQKLISDISVDFARVKKSNLDENIRLMLEKTGGFLDADRSYVFLFDDARNVMNLAFEWCRDGVEPELGKIAPFPLDRYPKWIETLSNHTTVYQQDVRKLSEDFITDNALFINKSVVSLISVPVSAGDSLLGFLGFSSFRAPIIISDTTLELLQTFANLLADKFTMAKTEEEIEYMAYYDQLTGLPNRLLFNDRARQAIHMAKRQSKHLGFIFMDLDSFKTVNDTMGHNCGDEIIREVASALSGHVRKTDTVARFGGDEFLILLTDIADSASIEKKAESIMGLFSQPFKLRDQEYFITASTGISVYPYDGEDADTLVKNADIAMYRAKALGSNQYILCTSDMKEAVQYSMILTNSLYRALERGEFLLHYQPQINTVTGAVIGLEALLRWNHPTLGMIPPSVFIPLAEKNGLIGSIGEWVLRTACRQNKAWQEMGLPRLRMAVNLSVIQFRNPKLVTTIETILRESGLSPEDLELEITESAAINETGYIVNTLKCLKQLGVSISIDDFGTEYSSLNRLKDLPIDRIKIDMQFIRGLEGNEKNQAITMIIINLAKNLGLRVIAEGVETEPQLQFLRTKDCDEVQGYFFFKPLPAEDITVMLGGAAQGAALSETPA